NLQGGHVVLLYPPDPEEALPGLICWLGSWLSTAGFSVSGDLWSRADHAEDWALAIENCHTTHGKAAPRCSPYSDVFTAALGCILSDCQQGHAGERFALVQFESLPALPLQSKQPLPEPFRACPVGALTLLRSCLLLVEEPNPGQWGCRQVYGQGCWDLRATGALEHTDFPGFPWTVLCQCWEVCRKLTPYSPLPAHKGPLPVCEVGTGDLGV
ncbi:hypothetical protein Z043_109187, partial [Scleropages formosus]